MFGRKQDKPGETDNPDGAPEGQAEYTPIDDVPGDEAPIPDEGQSEADEMLAKLRAELDDMGDRLKRTTADFQNYQRRALQNEHEARRQGVSAVVMSVVPVIDHFDLALSQKAEGAAAGILEGVRVIRAELIRALERQGVSVINPAVNESFDPTRHEAVVQRGDEGVEPGHISATLQPGFALGERVIRSAKVAVAPA